MKKLSDSDIREFRSRVVTGADRLGIKVSDHQAEQMSAFLRELVLWNSKINLTAIRDPLVMAEKHFIDSIAVIPFIRTDIFFMDMGSGGGFPGIPLKIMLPDLNMVLLDSSRKKVNFSKHVIRTLGLEKIDAVHARAEELACSDQYQGRFDAVISRAFADLDRFAVLAHPFLSDNGCLYAMKARRALGEITSKIRQQFEITTDHYRLPFEKSERCFITLSLHRTS